MLHRSGRTGRAGKKGTSVLIVPDPSRHYVERMLRLAHLDVKWTVAPSSEQIRELDQERLLTTLNPMFEELTDEDRVMGEKLLGQRSPVDLAAALMRMQRQQLPEAEDLTVPMSMRGNRNQDVGAGPSREMRPAMERTSERSERGAGPAAAREAIVTSRPGVHVERAERPARAERAPVASATEKPARAERPVREHREAIETRPERAPRTNRETAGAAGTPGSSWFAINVGTVKNADPKWLIPLLCRRGDVDKSAIGKIRVLARETHVEILAASRKKFAEAIARPIEANDKDKSIRIAALKVEQD
jgi:ATP-dependent RNA helicase DeaD